MLSSNFVGVSKETVLHHLHRCVPYELPSLDGELLNAFPPPIANLNIGVVRLASYKMWDPPFDQVEFSRGVQFPCFVLYPRTPDNTG